MDQLHCQLERSDSARVRYLRSGDMATDRRRIRTDTWGRLWRDGVMDRHAGSWYTRYDGNKNLFTSLLMRGEDS